MPTFREVVTILDTSVAPIGDPIGAHGPFWRTLKRDEFIAYSYRGEPLIAKKPSGEFDPDGSGLIKALEGRFPFGRDQGVPGARFRRMPPDVPPVSTVNIAIIREWIAAGCPA